MTPTTMTAWTTGNMVHGPRASASSGMPNRPDSDRVLLERLRGGDEAAYEELVRANMSRLLAVARRLLGNEEDARDALQQAFLSAFRALPAFHGESLLSTWLHRIVVNEALMKLRSRARRPEESIETWLPRFLEDGHHATPVPDSLLPADVLLARREVRVQVRKAIDLLPETHRTVLLLRDIEQLDTAETAEALGLSANAVKLRLHRARQALARILQPVLRPGEASRRVATPA